MRPTSTRAPDPRAQEEGADELPVQEHRLRRRRAQEALAEREVEARVARADRERRAGEVVGALLPEGLAHEEHELDRRARARGGSSSRR